ncbi:hypothetical protein F4809DRAFT_616868 [Biscogniauxia mediterranea]|nr:hypothetical protein F4809DRAFT_616868 [Biscogniauxia mediterranea]
MSVAVVDSLLAYVADLSPAVLCQLFYVLSAAAVLAVAAAPATVQRLLTQYGARGSGEASSASGPSSSSAPQNTPARNGTEKGFLINLVRWLTSVGKVPHSWFIHFYILSLSCSIFWAVQYVRHGTILEFLVTHQAPRTPASMTIGQVLLVWFFMCLQGARRLYEYLTVLRPSSSRMWVIHWLLGNTFYLCTNIAIWIEGSQSVWYSKPALSSTETLRLNLVVGVPMFLFAWLMQYRCHKYLSGLKKYSLPEDGLFQYLVCPHYTCECLLYLSLAIIAAPKGQLYNKTLLCAVLFVSVNLGVTAHGTKQWYCEKFGQEKVHGKWRMIPGVF